MATLNEVAREAGVSVSTASVVLNPTDRRKYVSPERAARVQEAARSLGYVTNYHARAIKTGLSHTIGVAMQIGGAGGTRLGDQYYSSMVGAMEGAMSQAGFATSIIGPRHDGDRVVHRGIKAIRQRQLDGLIIPGSPWGIWDDPDLNTTGLPMVLVEYRRSTSLPVVDWDEEAGVTMALEHLAELGHRRILWLGPDSDGPRDTGPYREKLAMRAAGHIGLSLRPLPYSIKGVKDPQDERPRRHLMLNQRAADALGEFLQHVDSQSYTAVLAFNDAVASGALNALHHAGLRVPYDMSVVGFDNILAPLLSPQLTSVDHVLPEVGRRAAKLVLEMIREPEKIESYQGRTETIQPHLKIGASTGPAKDR